MALKLNLIFEDDVDCGFFELEPYNDLFKSWDVRSLKQLERAKIHRISFTGI